MSKELEYIIRHAGIKGSIENGCLSWVHLNQAVEDGLIQLTDTSKYVLTTKGYNEFRSLEPNMPIEVDTLDLVVADASSTVLRVVGTQCMRGRSNPACWVEVYKPDHLTPVRQRYPISISCLRHATAEDISMFSDSPLPV